jgi:hypothetical protein
MYIGKPIKIMADQMNLTDVYRIFHTATAQYTFFSKIDHILGNKASLSKYKKTEIIPCILSDHNEVNEVNEQNSRCL